MISGVLNYLGPVDLTVYFVKETSITSDTLGDESRVVKVVVINNTNIEFFKNILTFCLYNMPFYRSRLH